MKNAVSTITFSANTSWYLFNFRASTIRALVGRGYRVVCLSPRDDYSRMLPGLGAEWRPLPMNNSGNNPVQDAVLVWRFWCLYRVLRPVVAFHFTVKNNVYGTWAARALGIPAVNNVSGLGTAFIRRGAIPFVVRCLYRLSQPLAHRVFCQNTEDLQLLRKGRLVPADRLTLLPGSGVDLQRFHPRLKEAHVVADLVKDASLLPFRLLYAGRMLADKGLHELVEAVRRINAKTLRCELSLCGFAGSANVSAISEATLATWSLRDDVKWLGPSDVMEQVYTGVDAVVLASYREGMPRSLLEACAMGLPIVATNVPGCRELVADGVNGILCEARSVDALESALERLLAMTADERFQMGVAGRARMEAEFDERQVVDAALQVVQDIEMAR